MSPSSELMDIKTLFVFISISGLCVLGLSVYVYWNHTRHIKGSLCWLGAILSISVASVLFGLSGVLPVRLNLHFSNTLLLLCPTLMTLSLRRLYGVNSVKLPLVLYGLSAVIFNGVVPVGSVNDRIVVFSLLFGLLWIEPTLLALRKGEYQSDRLLGLAFLFAASTSVLRAIGTFLYEKELTSLLEGGVLQQAYVVAMGIELFFFLASYILMLNSRTLDRISTSEAMLRAAIDNSPYGMVMTDRSGVVVSANATFEKATGYALPELQKSGLSLLQPDRREDRFPQEIWKTLLEGGNWESELHNRRKGGGRYWEKAVWSPIKKEDGTVTGFFGVTDDISHQKQLEEFKNEIENLMRHDLKAPLNAVINLPEIIQSEGGLNREQGELLATIRETGQSMLEQINGSLELYKLEEGSYRASHGTLDLREVFVTFQKTFIALTRARNVTLESTFVTPAGVEPAFPYLISTDRSLFKRLLGNLLKNAIEASPEGGVVQMKMWVEGGNLHIAIHNTGAIPEEARGRFFTKFNTVGKFGGTGLGAYGAKVIADYLKYGLTFTTSDEAGTTLEVCLPVGAGNRRLDKEGSGG